MWVALVILVLLPVQWAAALGVAASNGWTALGELYRRAGQRPTAERRFRSLSVLAGWLPCNYSGCVTVGTSPEGLFLRVLLPFRPFHPPLFIPWSAIQTTARNAWYGRWVELRVDGVPGVVVRLSKGTAVELADAVGGFGTEACPTPPRPTGAAGRPTSPYPD